VLVGNAPVVSRPPGGIKQHAVDVDGRHDARDGIVALGVDCNGIGPRRVVQVLVVRDALLGGPFEALVVDAEAVLAVG
jgi:hypothetical protein